MVYDVSAHSALDEFELPAINTNAQEATPTKSFDFTQFASSDKSDDKQDIKRFLNQHFRYLGEELNEN